MILSGQDDYMTLSKIETYHAFELFTFLIIMTVSISPYFLLSEIFYANFLAKQRKKLLQFMWAKKRNRSLKSIIAQKRSKELKSFNSYIFCFYIFKIGCLVSLASLLTTDQETYIEPGWIKFVSLY